MIYDPVEEPDFLYDPLQEDPVDEEEEPATWNCGNGIVEPPEECDDGNGDDCDGCTASCQWERAMKVEETAGAGSVEIVPLCLGCPFTIEAWIKMSEGHDIFGVVEIEGLVSLGFSTVSWGFDIKDFMTMAGGLITRLEPDTWHHFALSCVARWAAWDVLIFIDGEGIRYGSNMEEPESWHCGGHIAIGTYLRRVPPHLLLPGTIDDLRISNQGLYVDGETYAPERYLEVRPDTVALWKFNSEDGGVVRDVSGNGYDVVLENGMLVADECHAR
jgi:cysteine-rich repeat protein